MNKRTKPAIYDLPLELRETPKGEIERELHRYGLYAERGWIRAEALDRFAAGQRNERLEHVIQGDVEVDLPDWAVGPYWAGTAPYDADLDDGVKVNILPLQAAELLPYKKVV